MKQRFIITKPFFSVMGDTIWFFFRDCNWYDNIKDAMQYMSKQDALEVVGTFDPGIYKVEEIFVNE